MFDYLCNRIVFFRPKYKRKFHVSQILTMRFSQTFCTALFHPKGPQRAQWH